MLAGSNLQQADILSFEFPQAAAVNESVVYLNLGHFSRRCIKSSWIGIRNGMINCRMHTVYKEHLGRLWGVML